MTQVYQKAAGLDVHQGSVVVSICWREGKELVFETRSFGTYPVELRSLARWMAQQQVDFAVLESTGVYWRPVFKALRACCPEVELTLVNPAHVTQALGRKTDVRDSRKLAELALFDRLEGSFLPPQTQQLLREVTRHRKTIVEQQTRCHNRIIKLLESEGIKLASVCSDVLGVTGRAILRGLLQGETRSEELAKLAKGALRKKQALLARALEGAHLQATQKLVLEQLLTQLELYERQRTQLDDHVKGLYVPYLSALKLLESIPGVSTVTALTILAEMGPDIRHFPTSGHLASWAGLSPGSHESAGKKRSSPVRGGNPHLRTAMVQAGWAAVRKKNSVWGGRFRALAVRTGPKKAIVAIARRLLETAYALLRDGQFYEPPSPRVLPPERRERRARHHLHQLQELGYDVTLTPAKVA
jgi:transposase